MNLEDRLTRYEAMARGEWPIDRSATKAPLFPADKKAELLGEIADLKREAAAGIKKPAAVAEMRVGFVAGCLWGMGWYSKEELDV